MTSSNYDPARIDLYDSAKNESPYQPSATPLEPEPYQPVDMRPLQPAPQDKGTNTLAVLSTVASMSTPITGLGFIPGIVLGHIATRSIDRTGERGRGYAKFGLVTGYLFLALALVAVALLVVVMVGSGFALADLLNEQLG